ncbi:helix-turn-helix domain-containing protein [Ectothiorhodospira shaposhnikovii]|uniref:helix-turn-helix domain-containing protein n=1 Tax=Ectothiorhodospira shaposhnikovii TaxID=1054 RepID=UPI001EE88280|nr:helix-turn-helix domain-containing protein [Ectothiorhodospira shaposhnikovii]MCG5513644.1 helix-turn-helix domain-containing protein [Ectothiorhodospira shaposhnikovii]
MADEQERYVPAFAVVPLDVLRAPELSRRELQVLGILYAYARGKDQGWPSRETLADLLDTDRGNVRQVLRSLEKKGFVISTPGRGAGNLTRYRLTVRVPAEGEAKGAPGNPLKGVAHNPFPPEKKGWNRTEKGVILTPKRGENDPKKGWPSTPEGNEGNRKEHEGNTPHTPLADESTAGGPDQDLLGAPLTGAPSGSRPKPSKGGDYPEAFERLWEARPRRAGGDPKPAAFRAWRARIQEGRITEEQAHAKVLEYRRYCEGTGKVGTETVQQLATFFGPVKEGYRQEWALPKPAGLSGQPNSYQGLTAKDYGQTRAGILDDATPPARNGNRDASGNAGQVNHASKRTTDPNTTAHRWGRGTHAGILADAVESDQGGPGHE